MHTYSDIYIYINVYIYTYIYTYGFGTKRDLALATI